MNICIFGDSITWGAYDPDKGGWANRLKIYFEEKNEDIEIYNLGICGNTTYDLINRVENEARTRNSNLIIFAIGINDSKYLNTTKSNLVSNNDFEKNINELYQLARKITPNTIFIGLTPVDEIKTNPTLWDSNISLLNKRIKEFNYIIGSFCIKNKLKFISMDNVLDKNNLIDGLHPNTQGHIKMYERIKEEIEEYIKDNIN